MPEEPDGPDLPPQPVPPGSPRPCQSGRSQPVPASSRLSQPCQSGRAQPVPPGQPGHVPASPARPPQPAGPAYDAVPAGFARRDHEPRARGFAAGGPLDQMEPGPALAGFAADAAAGGLAVLDDDQLVGVLCTARRLASWAASIELRAVADLTARRDAAAAAAGDRRQADHVGDEVAAALTLTCRAADRLVSLAAGVTRLPGVAAALAAGRIDLPRAGVFADELAGLDDITAAAIAAMMARGCGRADDQPAAGPAAPRGAGLRPAGRAEAAGEGGAGRPGRMLGRAVRGLVDGRAGYAPGRGAGRGPAPGRRRPHTQSRRGHRDAGAAARRGVPRPPQRPAPGHPPPRPPPAPRPPPRRAPRRSARTSALAWAITRPMRTPARTTTGPAHTARAAAPVTVTAPVTAAPAVTVTAPDRAAARAGPGQARPRPGHRLAANGRAGVRSRADRDDQPDRSPGHLARPGRAARRGRRVRPPGRRRLPRPRGRHRGRPRRPLAPDHHRPRRHRPRIRPRQERKPATGRPATSRRDPAVRRDRTSRRSPTTRRDRAVRRDLARRPGTSRRGRAVRRDLAFGRPRATRLDRQCQPAPLACGHQDQLAGDQGLRARQGNVRVPAISHLAEPDQDPQRDMHLSGLPPDCPPMR